MRLVFYLASCGKLSGPSFVPMERVWSACQVVLPLCLLACFLPFIPSILWATETQIIIQDRTDPHMCCKQRIEKLEE